MAAAPTPPPLLFRPQLLLRGVRLLFGDHAMFFRRADFLAVGGCEPTLLGHGGGGFVHPLPPARPNPPRQPRGDHLRSPGRPAGPQWLSVGDTEARSGMLVVEAIARIRRASIMPQPTEITQLIFGLPLRVRFVSATAFCRARFEEPSGRSSS